MSDEPESYGLEPDFEEAVAQLCATDEGFWDLVGKEVDPELLEIPRCSLIVRACNEVKSRSQLAVVQRCRALHEDGEISRGQVTSARKLLEQLNGTPLDVEPITAELGDVLRKRAERDALEAGCALYARGESVAEIGELLDRARRIGAPKQSKTIRFGPDCVPRIASRNKGRRMPLGIEDLDLVLRGGMRCGCMGQLLGSTNSGKSMLLDHVVANAISYGHPCALATGELSVDDHFARITGNLVDLPYADIGDYDDVAKAAEARLEVLFHDGVVAPFVGLDIVPTVTTVSEIASWLDEEEKKLGRQIVLLATDSALELDDPTQKAMHEKVASVTKQLRALAKVRNMWIFNTHHVTGEAMNESKTKRVENQHVAGSKEAAKTPDLVISINPRNEGDENMFFVSKHRHGPRNQEVGPLPHDFEYGRMTPVRRKGWPF